MSKPLISICIPAYKNVVFLKRLLDSITIQIFKDFEVVITDDSNDNSVADFVKSASYAYPVKYIKNALALGSPENWNEGMRNSNGYYIKIMHDDDWFASSESLGKFAMAAAENPGVAFIFSGFNEVDVVANSKHKFVISNHFLSLLKKSPLYLFKRNFIGHPSTTLIKKENNFYYDNNLKWLVDIEFYIRFLLKYPDIVALRKPLVNIGINEYQITKQVFRNPEVEIPESLYLFHKLPKKSFRNLFVYDYYWRLIRNLSIRKVEEMRAFSKGVEIPDLIKQMILLQSRWPLTLLGKGVFSKSLMCYSYLINYRKL